MAEAILVYYRSFVFDDRDYVLSEGLRLSTTSSTLATIYSGFLASSPPLFRRVILLVLENPAQTSLSKWTIVLIIVAILTETRC
jgi:hypothetical protein